ncbi:hypothetical protein DXG01_015200 [Tephrocybe rancida]|nr:hypothetical protein DXG01_015200 [Tephrocybe rancida]
MERFDNGGLMALYEFLPDNITDRIACATSAMHAYVHEWACQIVFNPRIWRALGLTDGEGVERLWSRMRKLIGVTRSCGRSRRIYIVDHHVSSIGDELRDDLGTWLHRWLNKGIQAQGQKARQILAELGIEEEVLRKAPIRLKKELDTVLTLQGDLDACDKSLQATRLTLSKTSPTPNSLRILGNVQNYHEQARDHIEELYASLSVQESFPELHGVDLKFLRKLLVARDLKINVRKRAIGSFFEWDRLDQASGGTHQTLGLQKYNDICATLALTYDPNWAIPLPEPLPTELKLLRECPHLMQDIWISCPTEQVPHWLEDQDIREGIHAMLKADRCHEEQHRLDIEAGNLSRWYARELAAVELALEHPSSEQTSPYLLLQSSNVRTDARLLIPLQQRHTRLQNLQARWAGPLLPQHVFKAHTKRASVIAQALAMPLATSTPAPEYQPFSHQRTTYIDDDDFAQDNTVSVATDEHALTNKHLPMAGDKQEVSDPATTCFDAEPTIDSGLAHIEDVLVADYWAQEAANDVSTADNILPGVDVMLQWELPADVASHHDLLQDLQLQPFQEFEPLSKSRYFTWLGRQVIFNTRELNMMNSPTARINDGCINGIRSLLMDRFSESTRTMSTYSRQCALFSTHDLPRLRYNASDAEIWRRTRHMEYWTRPVWILPIFRTCSEHWVMSTIIPTTGEIYLFDSFGEKQPWKVEVQEIMAFVARLIILANSHGHPLHIIMSGWVARPTIIHPQQTNSFDCGIWVLANIAATLSGFVVAGAQQSDLEHVRKALLSLLLALPSIS